MTEISATIRSLEARFLTHVEELFSDFERTRMLWHELIVRVTRRKESFSVIDADTRTEKTSAELAAGATASVARLRERTFKDIVAQLEQFIGEVLRVWLRANPERLAEKAISVSVLLSSDSLRAALATAIDEAAESTITGKLFGKPVAWFAYLHQNLGWIVDRPDRDRFIEMKARRDVMEHRQSIVEHSYFQKAGPAKKFEVGDVIIISPADVVEAHQLISKLIRSIAGAATGSPSASMI